MKGKIGNIEFEGTPEEIRELINNQPKQPLEEIKAQTLGGSKTQVDVASAGNFGSGKVTSKPSQIHDSIKLELDKDYDN